MSRYKDRLFQQAAFMAFFRQYIAPFFILLIFLVALLAVSVRIFLPADMAQPAPTDDMTAHYNAPSPPTAWVG